MILKKNKNGYEIKGEQITLERVLALAHYKKIKLDPEELEYALLEMEKQEHNYAYFGDINGLFMFSERQ